MEGSANSKNVDNYQILAEYYDELLQDEDSLSLWLDHIESEPFGSVLEFASGSGVMAGILKSKGYDIIASDISEAMKDSSAKNYDGEYLLLNMTDYHLDRKFDLILCICDSVNYLYEQELDSFFRCAYEHLNDNGRLIFDMHHRNRLKEFSEMYIEEGYVLDTPYQWTIESDEMDDTICEHFTFYTNDGMIQEHHQQNVFDIDTIKDKMESMFDTEVMEDFVEDEKVLVTGRKK